MKYPEQGRLCMGVATIISNEGEEEGHHCIPYCYTRKTVNTIVVYKKLITEELTRVKNLKEGGHNLVENFCHPDDLWEEEKLDKVKGIGKAKQNHLAAKGFTMVKHLKYATISEINKIATDRANKLTMNSLQKLKQLVEHALPGDIPSDVMVDHQKADNPYKS